MTDPERDHLLQCIRDLERSRGRWRLATLVLAIALALPAIGGGLLGMWWTPRLQMERERAQEAQIEVMRAMEAEERARAAMEEAQQQRHLAEERRQQAEKELQDAPKRPGKDKD